MVTSSSTSFFPSFVNYWLISLPGHGSNKNNHINVHFRSSLLSNDCAAAPVWAGLVMVRRLKVGPQLLSPKNLFQSLKKEESPLGLLNLNSCQMLLRLVKVFNKGLWTPKGAFSFQFFANKCIYSSSLFVLSFSLTSNVSYSVSPPLKHRLPYWNVSQATVETLYHLNKK